MKTRLGNFEIIEPIRAGGDGGVYRAVEHLAPGIHRAAAVKILKRAPFEPENEERTEDLRREVATLAELGSCPNIVTIYGCGTDEEVGPWIAMELAGPSLREFITDTPADPEQVRVLLRDVLRALSVLHGAEPPILHRDLKPTNILAGRFGNWQLADFGLARRGDSEDTLDLMTVKYAAPELLDATLGPESPRVDLYSLGMIAYETALGRDLFRAQFPSIYDPDAKAAKPTPDERPKWMYWHTSLQMPLPPPAGVIKDYPQDLSDLISALTAKPFRDRIESADDALKRLGDVVATVSSEAPDFFVPDRKPGQEFGLRTLLLAVLTVLLLLATGLFAYERISDRPRVNLAGDGHFSASAPDLTISGTIENFPRDGAATVILRDGSRHQATVARDGTFSATVTLKRLGDSDAAVSVTDRRDKEVARSIARLDRTAPEKVRIGLRTVPPVPGADVVFTPSDGAPIQVRTGDDGSASSDVSYGSFELSVDHPRFRAVKANQDTGFDPTRSLRARLTPLTAAEVVAKRDGALDEIDGLADALARADPDALARFTALHTLLGQLELDPAAPADDAAPGVGAGANPPARRDPDSIQRAALLVQLGALTRRLADREPGAVQRLKALTEQYRELDPPPAVLARGGEAAATGQAEVVPDAAELARASSANLAHLSLAQFKVFLEDNVPTGALTITPLPQQSKVRVHGPVFNQAELKALLERLAIAAPRLELEVQVDPWAVCRRLERAMAEHGARDARAVAILIPHEDRLFVQFNATESFDRDAAGLLARTYVLDDHLLFIQDYVPSTPPEGGAPAGR